MEKIISKGTYVELEPHDGVGICLGVTLEQDFYYDDCNILRIDRYDCEEGVKEFATLDSYIDLILIVETKYLVDVKPLGAVVH